MLLQVEDLKTYFDTEDGVLKAVDGLSFSLDAGKTLGIVGESGSGKSVTALSLCRLLPMPPARIVSGEILFEGENILNYSKEQLYTVRGNAIAMIFQEPMTSLNPVYTVGFQIAEALKIHRSQLNSNQRRDRVVQLLELVGIGEASARYSDYPHQMSGGMRQRVMIAMALSCEPKLLIADEPTTALDVTIQAQILELMKKLQRELGMAVILITHDLGVVAKMVDTVAVMYAGKIVEMAPVKELFKEPLHPYTRGLLDSMPSGHPGGDKKHRLNAIPGNVPNLIHLPTGCSFQDRCPMVQTNCRRKEPSLEVKGGNHRVSCFEVG